MSNRKRNTNSVNSEETKKVETPVAEEVIEETAEEKAVEEAKEPAVEEVTTKTGKVVNCPGGLRFRKAASLKGEVISVIPQGLQLEVISENGDWSQVKVGDVEGFVMSKFIEVI